MIHIASQSGFLDPQRDPSGRTAFLDSSRYIVFLINVTFCGCCVFLVAVAFSVYAVVLFGMLWLFNVSVVLSVCRGVCLFVIVGGVCLLWHFLVCCGIVRFAVLFFGLLSRFSVCCNVFRSACAMFPFVRQQFKNSTSPMYTLHSGLEI